jgi:hypothetical protein
VEAEGFIQLFSMSSNQRAKVMAETGNERSAEPGVAPQTGGFRHPQSAA